MKKVLNKEKLNKDEKIDLTKHKYLKGIIYGLIGTFAFLGFLSVINNPANNPLNYISPKKPINNTTAITKPISKLDKCIQEAEMHYKENLKKEKTGYDLFDPNQKNEYRRKMIEQGNDPKRVDNFILQEMTRLKNIDYELQDRMMQEKELCGKLYNK